MELADVQHNPTTLERTSMAQISAAAKPAPRKRSASAKFSTRNPLVSTINAPAGSAPSSSPTRKRRTSAAMIGEVQGSLDTMTAEIAHLRRIVESQSTTIAELTAMVVRLQGGAAVAIQGQPPVSPQQGGALQGAAAPPTPNDPPISSPGDGAFPTLPVRSQPPPSPPPSTPSLPSPENPWTTVPARRVPTTRERRTYAEAARQLRETPRPEPRLVFPERAAIPLRESPPVPRTQKPLPPQELRDLVMKIQNQGAQTFRPVPLYVRMKRTSWAIFWMILEQAGIPRRSVYAFSWVGGSVMELIVDNKSVASISQTLESINIQTEHGIDSLSDLLKRQDRPREGPADVANLTMAWNRYHYQLAFTRHQGAVAWYQQQLTKIAEMFVEKELPTPEVDHAKIAETVAKKRPQHRADPANDENAGPTNPEDTPMGSE